MAMCAEISPARKNAKTILEHLIYQYTLLEEEEEEKEYLRLIELFEYVWIIPFP